MSLGRKSSSICQCPTAICPSSFASSSCIVVAAALDGGLQDGDDVGVRGLLEGGTPLAGVAPPQVAWSACPPGCWRRAGGLRPRPTPDDGVVVAVQLGAHAQGFGYGRQGDNKGKSWTHGKGS